MNERLAHLLEHLCRVADARRQAEVEERHRRALAREPVDRLPVVISTPPELGGGGIHSCGCVNRHVKAFLDVDNVRCIDFGQAELNDVDAIHVQAAVRGVPLVRVAATEADLASGRVLDRFATGVSLVHRAASLADARRVMDAYRPAAQRRTG